MLTKIIIGTLVLAGLTIAGGAVVFIALRSRDKEWERHEKEYRNNKS